MNDETKQLLICATAAVLMAGIFASCVVRTNITTKEIRSECLKKFKPLECARVDSAP